MSFGAPSWIALSLVGDHLASSVAKVTVRTLTYGSTAGPFTGMGGAAMSNFDIAVLTLRGGEVLVFADRRLLGWVSHERAAEVVGLFNAGRLTERDLSAPPPALQTLLDQATDHA